MRHTLSRLEPSRDTVEVEGMVTDTPSDRTIYEAEVRVSSDGKGQRTL
jgi:hypothetical protein